MYRVLVVDDDKLGRKGLISIIPWGKCGMSVVGDVANGKLALDFLAENAVELVVVDLSMPVMSGLEFIEISRTKYPDLQYVVLSFHEDFEYVQSALRLGALDYISKLRMEDTDCAEVFRRVGHLLALSLENKERAGEASIPTEQEIGVSTDELEQLREDWDDGRWLFSTELFATHMDALATAPLTLRQMERLLVWISQGIESIFGLGCPVPFLAETKEAFAWLHKCRSKLYERALHAVDHSRISLCILQSAIYIREHLTEHIKGEDVARQVGMSRSYFSVNFKNITGYTFNDYLRCERIELAKQLLLQKKVRPTEVAEAVGYEDSKYFARIFLEQTGVTCSEYTKQKSL